MKPPKLKSRVVNTFDHSKEYEIVGRVVSKEKSKYSGKGYEDVYIIEIVIEKVTLRAGQTELPPSGFRKIGNKIKSSHRLWKPFEDKEMNKVELIDSRP